MKNLLISILITLGLSSIIYLIFALDITRFIFVFLLFIVCVYAIKRSIDEEEQINE